MAMNLNQVTLIGNVGNDLDLGHTTSNMPVVNFRIATKDFWNNQYGEREEKTVWHNITAWGRLAEIASQNLKRGQTVVIIGRIDFSTYEKNGMTITKNFVVAEQIQFDARQFDTRSQSQNQSQKERVDDARPSKVYSTHQKKRRVDEGGFQDLDEDLIPF